MQLPSRMVTAVCKNMFILIGSGYLNRAKPYLTLLSLKLSLTSHVLVRLFAYKKGLYAPKDLYYLNEFQMLRLPSNNDI